MLMHKYSYPYLGQLELSSGAFILLVDVTKPWMKVTCDKFNMIWRGTHILIKGPIIGPDNAYQITNQALRKEKKTVCRAQKQVCIQPHIYGKSSETLKGHRSMQSLLALIEEFWLEWWWRTWWSLVELHDHMWRYEKPPEGQISLQHSTELAFMAVCKTQSSPQWRQKKTHLQKSTHRIFWMELAASICSDNTSCILKKSNKSTNTKYNLVYIQKNTNKVNCIKNLVWKIRIQIQTRKVQSIKNSGSNVVSNECQIRESFHPNICIWKKYLIYNI